MRGLIGGLRSVDFCGVNKNNDLVPKLGAVGVHQLHVAGCCAQEQKRLKSQQDNAADCCEVLQAVAGKRAEKWGLIGGLRYAQRFNDE